MIIHRITNANVHQQKVRTARAHVPQKFDKSNKKGYLLVINYMFPGDEDKKRIASDYDVGSLCKFFTKINYDIDCRTDMTTTELKQCLERVRNDMLTRDSSKYHCFICVIMSHGGERGISTKDGYMELDYIVNFFRNERVKKFVGKPKIFIFQSCRGSDIQQKQEQIKSSIVLGDSSSPVQKLPNHADILRIYATTPGHVAYRKSGSSRWNGSWLINAFLQAASGMYLKHHIEDIMTVVRHQLSTNPEYENDGEKCQIAVSENTLTKHFFL